METGLVGEVIGLLDNVDDLDARELEALVQEVTRIERAATAVRAAATAVAHRTAAFRDDGHLSVRGWVAATVDGPSRVAFHTCRLATVGAAHPVVFEHLAAGAISVDAAVELARVHANPRVRDAFADVVHAFVTVAAHAPFEQFVVRIRQWEQLNDAEGSRCDDEAAHQRRRAHLSTIGNATFLDVCVGAIAGETIESVLERFAEAEFAADWADVVARHGADATPALLDRTDAQRRADAVVAIFRRAAATSPDAREPEPLVSIVASQTVYDEQLAAMLEDRPARFDLLDAGERWCTTSRGRLIDPADAVVASLMGHVRRVVLDAQGRVIDLGRRRRLFTGAAREAVLLQAVLDRLGGRCSWPGCGRRRTQLDHATEWHDLGRTHPHNGTWPCGPHNRFKSRGYRVWRDPAGTWHTYRPDGSEIKAA